MNSFISLALLGLVYCMYTTVAITRREACTTNSDCSTTTCSSGSTVICQHPPDAGIQAGNGLCTCNSGVQCTNRTSCYSSSIDLNCPNSERHCYDNVCICDRFPPQGRK